MNISDIKELIREVSNSEIDEFQYEDDGGMLSLVKGKRGTVVKEYIKEDIVVPQAEEKVFIEETDMNVKTVTSPLVGTVYMAPAEGEEPFVSVGDVVKKGQVLAIVEAMKLMNEIESEYDGVIKEICVNNEEAVEFGQKLFVIE
ncbi:MAG: acetyl-CoA carboxylase biotin carboxyl carrier protein [Eubacterium sp.]|jgi:acetyl-CoA carboxylase biotin carboxyl carrier protein|nr:acetyl-CoA carboxylase biotin carboxyl carrier protein [Eubacterium sp.]